MRNEEYRYNSGDYEIASRRMASHGLGLDLRKLWEAGVQPIDIADELKAVIQNAEPVGLGAEILFELQGLRPPRVQAPSDNGGYIETPVR